MSLAAVFCLLPLSDSLISFSVSGEIASRTEHTPDTGANRKIITITARRPARHPAQTRCFVAFFLTGSFPAVIITPSASPASDCATKTLSAITLSASGSCSSIPAAARLLAFE